MEEGQSVNLMGIWQSFKVVCNDDTCERLHYADGQAGYTDGAPNRYHFEDGPREGRAGIYRGDENGRPIVELADGKHTILTADSGDVEEVTASG